MVSVCIATYNGERFILTQLESIINQLSDDDEIIISDDNSTDKTIDIIKKINDKRIKIFINDKGLKGYTNNFENALKKASKKYIFLSDQDDIWRLDKVEIMLKYLKKYDFVLSDAALVDFKLNSLNKTFFEIRGKGVGFISNMIKQKSLGCCMAFNKKILKKALPFPENKKKITHDLWLTLISGFYFKPFLISDTLINYRRHDNNVSLGGEKGNSSLSFKIKYRFYAMVEIIKRFFK